MNKPKYSYRRSGRRYGDRYNNAFELVKAAAVAARKRRIAMKLLKAATYIDVKANRRMVYVGGKLLRKRRYGAS